MISPIGMLSTYGIIASILRRRTYWYYQKSVLTHRGMLDIFQPELFTSAGQSARKLAGKPTWTTKGVTYAKIVSSCDRDLGSLFGLAVVCF